MHMFLKLKYWWVPVSLPYFSHEKNLDTGIKLWQTLSTAPVILAKTSLLFQTMGDKSVKTLSSKIWFLSILETFPTLRPQTMLIFIFLRRHKPQLLHNIELGGWGIRKLTLDANSTSLLEINTKKCYFLSVSTIFDAHCRSAVYIQWMEARSICRQS